MDDGHRSTAAVALSGLDEVSELATDRRRGMESEPMRTAGGVASVRRVGQCSRISQNSRCSDSQPESQGTWGRDFACAV